MTQHTHANGPWPGTWLVNCDVCGINISSDKIRKRWDGLLVCKKDWEEDHPQKYIRVGPDPIAVPIKRPESTDGTGDVFLPQCNTFVNQAIAGVANAGCARTGTYTNVAYGGSFTPGQIAQEEINVGSVDPFFANVQFLYVGGGQLFNVTSSPSLPSVPPPIPPNTYIFDSSGYVNANYNTKSGAILLVAGNNNCGIETTPQLFGGQSFRMSENNFMRIDTPADARTIGTQDFTLEFAWYWYGLAPLRPGTIFDARVGSISSYYCGLFDDIGSGTNYLWEFGCSGSSTVFSFRMDNTWLGNWKRIAIQRKAGVWSMYLDGVVTAGTFFNNLNLQGQGIHFGSNFFGASAVNNTVNIEQIRYTVGVARYSGSTYTLATRSFPTR